MGLCGTERFGCTCIFTLAKTALRKKNQFTRNSRKMKTDYAVEL